jgi:hypothetical protein
MVKREGRDDRRRARSRRFAQHGEVGVQLGGFGQKVEHGAVVPSVLS